MSNDLIVIARNPEEMATAQKALVEWAENKVYEADQELAELQQNLAVAQRERWKTGGLLTAVRLARRRSQFYEKMKAAVEAGYVIVPNFPIDMFAIRTEKLRPEREQSSDRWDQRLQKSEAPKLGEGRYVSDEPAIFSRTYSTAEDKKETYYWADAFQDVDFPLKFAKVTVLDDVSKALALNIFDEIGVLPARAAKVDPMVIGQIVYRKSTYVERRLSFLITWWLNEEHLTI